MITGIGSYFQTTQEFGANWLASNGELAPASLILAGQYTQAMFVSDRTTLLALIEDASAKADAARIIAGNRDTNKANLMTRGKQFRGVVAGTITEKQALEDLPPMPDFKENAALFLDVFRKMSRLWARINLAASSYGLSGPLLLQGGYPQDAFEEDVIQTGNWYEGAVNADELLGDARGKRDNAMKAIYERMKQYRALAPAALPANSPALANLPRLTPEPGTTPPGLVVTGQWDATLGKAVFDWPVSTFKNLDKLQVRGSTGTIYKSENEEVIADLAKDATHFETDWGLSAPGAKISVKVYVMATTGNENGGKAVKIVRPEV